MLPLLIVTLTILSPTQGPGNALDVSALPIGSPVTITQLDAGTLKGEPRLLAWSPDGESLYLQSVEGQPPKAKVRHCLLPRSGGPLTALDAEPGWAIEYWNVKQDRVAPGVRALVIEIEQTTETIQGGPGPAGALDRSNPGAATNPNQTVPDLAGGTSGNQKAAVVRLKLLGEQIAKWVNPKERPVPGTRFGWGPAGSGAIVYLGEHGGLVFFDRQKHKRSVPGVKDALLPAWSLDGRLLAYLQKAGRNKYVVAWLSLEP